MATLLKFIGTIDCRPSLESKSPVETAKDDFGYRLDDIDNGTNISDLAEVLSITLDDEFFEFATERVMDILDSGKYEVKDCKFEKDYDEPGYYDYYATTDIDIEHIYQDYLDQKGK